jgi:hypothetical protein
LRKATIINFIMSVSLPISLRETTHLDGFSWNFTFGHFSKICRDNSRFVTLWQEKRVIYIKTPVRLWLYLAHFFLEREMFQAKVVEKIKTHFYIQ